MRAVLALALALALGLGLGSCVVVRTPQLAERPRWHVRGSDAYSAGCVSARAFVRKSGREGMGLAVQLRSHGDCRIAIAGGQLVVGEATVPVPALAEIALRGRSQLYAWLPVHFDGAAAWNAGARDARLVLQVTVDGNLAAPWTLALDDVMAVQP